MPAEADLTGEKPTGVVGYRTKKSCLSAAFREIMYS
jgi:hypothetical protein